MSAEGTLQTCQQPTNCPVQQQSCTKCSTSPGGLLLGLSRTRGMLQRPSLQMLLRLRLRLRLRLGQRTHGMGRLRSRQSRWVLLAKRVRLSAASRTFLLGQASGRHQQRSKGVGRAHKPAGDSAETHTAARYCATLLRQFTASRQMTCLLAAVAQTQRMPPLLQQPVACQRQADTGPGCCW